jgi:hypothetical protein
VLRDRIGAHLRPDDVWQHRVGSVAHTEDKTQLVQVFVAWQHGAVLLLAPAVDNAFNRLVRVVSSG